MSFRTWLTKFVNKTSSRGLATTKRRRRPLLGVEQLEKRELLSATNNDFVSQVYRDLLKRDVEPAGLKYWNTLLDQGSSRVQIVVGFTQSQEYKSDFVHGLYNTYLHRSAEPQELDFWVQSLNNNHRVDDVIAGFIGSDEYFRVEAGGTNGGFLAAAYRDVLGRDVEPAGQTYWENLLATGATRQDVTLGIVSSLEADRNLVQGYYEQYFRREAEPRGLDYWAGLLQGGMAQQSVLAGIVGSEEYFLGQGQGSQVPSPPPSLAPPTSPPSLDTTPPVITLTSIASPINTNLPTFTGTVGTVPGDLSIAITVQVYSGGSATGTPFETPHDHGEAGSYSVTASAALTPDGIYTVQAAQGDAAGNTGFSNASTFTVDTTPPKDTTPPAITLTSIASPINTNLPTFTGTVGTVPGDLSAITVQVYSGGSATGTPFETLTTTASAGSYSVTASAALTPDGIYTVQAAQGDAAGNTGFSSANTFTVDTTPPLTSTADFAAATEFLYTGPGAVQTGVAADTIVPGRAAVVRGKVVDRTEQPLAGVTVTVLSHPEFGQTTTATDGTFSLAVNGGGLLTFVFTKDGYLMVQNQANVAWQDYTILSEAALTPLDGHVTAVDLSSPAPIQVAQGSIETDADGTRQATVLFPQGESATMTLPDGSVQPLTSLDVRATEFTVGDTGPMAMPGALPPTSAYTYCVELSVDQAQQAGATQVTFSQAVPFYVQNFLNFPVGMAVPTGYYDRGRGEWIPSDNGRVIKVLSVTNGEADLDTDGDGNPDNAAMLGALGITDAERTQLAALYQPGQSLWRMPITHFTPWDCNWPAVISISDDATYPTTDPNSLTDGEVDHSNQACGGSVISVENQTLGESIPVVGTPFSLNYQSDRVPGDTALRTLTIPLTRQTLPPGLKRVELTIDVAGREFTQSFTPATSLSAAFTWDGLDAFGRLLQGSQTAHVDIGYVYQGVYGMPDPNSRSFGAIPSGPINGNPARLEVTLDQKLTATLGGDAAIEVGLGGWTPDILQAYDPNSQTLHLGTGQDRGSDNVLNYVPYAGTRIAGNGTQGFGGDGGSATAAALDSESFPAVGPDGTLYIADSGNNRVRRVGTDGIITSVAGNGTQGFGGDGGPASNASLNNPQDIAIGPDGSLYIADTGNNRVRRVRPDGTITTVAGNGTQGFSGDGGPATAAALNQPTSIAVGPDGSLYIAVSSGQFGGDGRVRRVSPDGTITTVAGVGFGTGDGSGDGGPAPQAELGSIVSIACAPDGSLYIADRIGGIHDFYWQVHRVGLDGIIHRVAGEALDDDPVLGVGFPATQTYIQPTWITIGPDDCLYFTDPQLSGSICRVTPDGIITSVAQLGSDGLSLAIGPDGSYYVGGLATIRRTSTSLPAFNGSSVAIPSEDGSELYLFNSSGRHLQTLDALTNAVIFSFGYDNAGRLTSVTDGDGNVTTIERDAAGNPTAIVSPYGQRTTLAVNADGYLASVTDPANETTTLGYAAGGLLTRFTDPLGQSSVMSYGADGRLFFDQDAANGSTTLTRQELGGGSYKVTTTDAVGGTRQYLVEKLPDGSVRRTAIDGRGFATVTLIGPDGSRFTTLPDGTKTRVTFGPDPRFGMLAPVATTQTLTTPSSLTSTTTDSRVAATEVINDPASPLVSSVDTVVVNGKTFTTAYDANAHTITSTSAEGRTVVTTVDSHGRVVKVQSPGVDDTLYTYDSRGRLSTITQGNRTVTCTYDVNGNLATITDPLNRTTSLAYDNADRLTQQTQTDGSVIVFQYDAAGNMVGLTPPGDPESTFTYDPHDDLVSSTPPAVGADDDTTRYVYNLAHQLVQESLPGGAEIDFAYCECGRLTSITAPWGTYTYTYSTTTGELSSLQSPGGFTLSFGQDGVLDTSETLTGPVSGSVSWTYNSNFQVTSESVDGANPVTFSYDNDGLLTKAGNLTITRDPGSGRITGTTLGTVTDAVGYDEFGDESTYQATIGANAALADTYTRDALGRITRKVETVDGVTTTTDYSYDLKGQLTTVTENGFLVQTYTYDANSNRLSLTTPSGTTTGTYNAQDQLLTYGTKSYTYAPDGSLRSVTDSGTGQTTHYTYDAFGNLTEVDLPDGRVITYLLDGENRRVGKEVNGVLTQGLLYDGQLTPVAALNPDGSVAERFVYATGVNVPAYMIKGGVTYRLVTDNLGSVRLVVNVATGAIAQRLGYDAFGRVVLDTNPGFQPFGYAGGLYDPDTGLVRFGARDYDAEARRWTAKDPIGFAGNSTNQYTYSSNSALTLVDYNGLQPAEPQNDQSADIAGKAVTGMNDLQNGVAKLSPDYASSSDYGISVKGIFDSFAIVAEAVLDARKFSNSNDKLDTGTEIGAGIASTGIGGFCGGFAVGLLGLSGPAGAVVILGSSMLANHYGKDYLQATMLDAIHNLQQTPIYPIDYGQYSIGRYMLGQYTSSGMYIGP